MTQLFRGLPIRSATPLNRVQKAMAKGMKSSLETLAISQLARELDLTGLLDWRDAQPQQYSLNALLLAASARALAANPNLNAFLAVDQVLVFDVVNLGMAVATPAGLIVVVIPNADKLSLAEMQQTSEELAGRARRGQVTLADVEGGTFTVSNLGMLGVDTGNPIPRPPESCVLLLGAARPRPVVADGQIVPHTTCFATLSYDHRFIDGAMAAAYLKSLNELITTPGALQ